MAKQRGPIALYGATGYTGQLVAAELAAAGADFVLSGRNRSKLEVLAERLGRSAAVHPAPLDDSAALRSLMENCASVISCAGPFTHYGEPVLRAAIETGTHYLDTTGEQPYMDLIFRRFSADAEKAGVAAIPAMGFDYVPGDMLAHRVANGMGPLSEIELDYSVAGFGATRGTMLSSLEILKGGDVEYRDGAWRPAPQSFGRGQFDFGEPIGKQRMVRYPAGEQITVPRHVETENVKMRISASTLAPGPMAAALPVLGRPFGLAMHTPLKRALGAAIARLPEGPKEEDRRNSRYTIVCTARTREETRTGRATGRDVYGLTAALAAKGAIAAAERGFRGKGALAPSQAFDPEKFLDGLDRFEVRAEVEETREPEPAAVPAPA